MSSVTITEKAASEIKRVMTEQEMPENMRVRIGVSGGGCSGMQYSFGFDENTSEAEDEVTEQHGVGVAVNKQFSLHLDGTVVDFKDELHQRGFVFNNPNAVKSCGCGNSFSS